MRRLLVSVATLATLMISASLFTAPVSSAKVRPAYIECSVLVWKLENTGPNRTDVSGGSWQAKVLGAFDSHDNAFCNETQGQASLQEGATECNLAYSWTMSFNLDHGSGSLSGCHTNTVYAGLAYAIGDGITAQFCMRMGTGTTSCASWVTP